MLVALDHRAGDAPVEAFERFGQQRGFTGSGAGDQVQRQLFAGGKAGAVANGDLVIFVQHVDFHLQHLALAHARRVGTRFTVAVMQVARVGTLRRKGNAGQGCRRARGRGKGRGAKRGVGTVLIPFYIQVAFGATAGTTHTLLLLDFEALDLHAVIRHDAQPGALTLRTALYL